MTFPKEIPGSFTPTELERSLITPLLVLLTILLIISTLNLVVKIVVNLHIIIRNYRQHIFPPRPDIEQQHLVTPTFEI